MGHRKLMYAVAPSANQPASCRGYCDPSCLFSCPEYYSPPPAAPPYWAPPPPAQTPADGSGTSRFPPAVIVVVAFLGGLFLLVSYYVIIVKTCLHRGRRSRSRDHPPLDGGGGGGEEFIGENRVDHPIWYIRTVGLSPAAISSIAVCEYRKGEGLVEGSDCTVCLSEFSDGESLRVLPKCGHAFHVPCIDMWLRSHTNCPLCRAPIVGHSPPPLPPPERLSQPLDGDANRAVGAVVSGGENSNGAGAEEGVESGESNSDGLSKEIVEVNGQEGQLGLVVEEEEEGVVPVRRSVSMDSPFLVIELRGGSESQSSDDANTSELRTIDDSSSDRANPSSRSEARSLSWSGRLFMPRHNNSNGRTSSNSTLPR